MSHPKTAILVLSYNGLSVTKRFFSHLYENTQNFQVVMVDNGSTDGSVEYLTALSKEKNDFLFTPNPTNLGVINGRNYAYEIYRKMEDRAPYLIFLDNDQFVQPGWLEQHHSAMSQGRADLVGVEAWVMSKTFMPIKRCTRSFEPWTYIGCGGMMVKEAVAQKIGMFDEQFNPCYFEDPDYCFRAIDAGFKLFWNHAARVIHQPHQTLGLNPRRKQNFLESGAKFRKKWGHRKLPILRSFGLTAVE